MQLSGESGEKPQPEGRVEDTRSAPWALGGYGGGWGVALVLSQDNTGDPAVGVPGVCLLQSLRPTGVHLSFLFMAEERSCCRKALTVGQFYCGWTSGQLPI